MLRSQHCSQSPQSLPSPSSAPISAPLSARSPPSSKKALDGLCAVERHQPAISAGMLPSILVAAWRPAAGCQPRLMRFHPHQSAGTELALLLALAILLRLQPILVEPSAVWPGESF